MVKECSCPNNENHITRMSETYSDIVWCPVCNDGWNFKEINKNKEDRLHLEREFIANLDFYD